MKRLQTDENRNFPVFTGIRKVYLALMFFMIGTSMVFAQTTITGTIKDKAGDPIPGDRKSVV